MTDSTRMTFPELEKELEKWVPLTESKRALSGASLRKQYYRRESSGFPEAVGRFVPVRTDRRSQGTRIWPIFDISEVLQWYLTWTPSPKGRRGRK